ncbi:phage tail protein [Klebsiella electrica]|uniref:phage tail protein n=1 Tax=Klebsiella electrica TaxID=1259973 RepID=UPI003F769477
MKDKDYLSTLKSALLKSEPTVIKTELFGANVFIRRLTGDYLISYEEKMAETAKTGVVRGASEQVIQIVIDALVQPDGTAIPDEFKPTAAELLKAHENPELLEAVDKVKRHSIGTLEEAEKN